MTQPQPEQGKPVPEYGGDSLPAIPDVLFRLGRFFVRAKPLALVPRFEICRLDAGPSVTVIEERFSLGMATARCAALARSDVVQGGD